MENPVNPMFPNERKSIFQSTTAKMIMVGILTLVLLIPLSLVQNLIEERSYRKKEATHTITNSWGSEITVMGPILKVPYTKHIDTEVLNPATKEKSITTTSIEKYAYFLPYELNQKTTVGKVDKLKLGLYKPIVFKAKIQNQGSFKELNYEILGIEPQNINWEKASLIVKTTNLKSIKSELFIQLNQNKYALETNGDEDSHFDTLETPAFAINPAEPMTFSFDIQYNGSESIEFIPVGKTTNTSIDAQWHNPSFIGDFAANDTTKEITNESFKADWKIMHVNRPFSQQYKDKLPNLNKYSYGVKLIETVDHYQQSERASKYGFLMIGLTFLTFFLIQTISKINIHIFQYTMIGLALIMFYTLLISITEHSSFNTGYGIASVAVIVMIWLYSVSVLKNKKISGFIALSLLVLYSFIYIIIQMEDYALLAGSIGLFLILGTVMYFSRKIDWKS